MSTLILAALLTLPSDTAPKADDRYAAVAYSTTTGEYWFAWGLPTRAEAEAVIVKRARDRDSLIVYAAKNCYLALAKSKDGKGFGVGEGDTPGEAEKMALAACRKRSRTKPSILVVIHTAQGLGGTSYSCIAYSPKTHRFGVAVAKSSQSAAESEALDKCDADDAKIVATVKDGECAALALGKKKGEFGAAVAKTEKEAKSKALEACKKKTDDCEIAITLTGRK